MYVHYDLDLGVMTFGQGHNIPLCYGQQLCEILSRSNLTVMSYGPETDFGYVCTVTMTLEIILWVKVMTNTWVMDNKHVKYPDPTFSVRSYGPDTDLRHMCTMTLTLEI